MKTKQVVAFLMAATLTVTSGGVSALASQNAAEALQEETAIEELITEEGTDGEIREDVGDQYQQQQIVSDDESERVKLTLTPNGKEAEDGFHVPYGDNASFHVAIEVTGDPQFEALQIVEKDTLKVAAEKKGSEITGKEVDLDFPVKEDKEYFALAVFRVGTEAARKYSQSEGTIKVIVDDKEISKDDIVAPSSSIDITVSASDLADEQKKELDGKSVDELAGAVEGYIDTIVKDALTKKGEELKKSDYGTWEMDPLGDKVSDLKEIGFTFTSGEHYKLPEDVEQPITVKVPVNITKNILYIRIRENGESNATKPAVLTYNLSKTAKDIALEAKVYPEDAANGEVTWESSNKSAFTIAESKKNTLAVATKVSNGSSTITATAKDGSGVSAKVTVSATNQMTPSDIDFDMFTTEMEYRGPAPVADYLSDVLEAANASVQGIGKYAIVPGVEVEKFNEEEGDQGKKEVTYSVKFTLDDAKNAKNEEGDNAKVWDGGSYTKSDAKLTVTQKIITRDEALKEILGDNMNKTSFSIGTTLDTLTEGQPKGKYSIKWFKEDGKTAAPGNDKLGVGSRTYVLSYELVGDDYGYKLAYDDHTYKITFSIEEPKLDVEIVTNHPEKTDNKYPEGTKGITLQAKVNGDVVEGSDGDEAAKPPIRSFYDLTYNWVYKGNSVQGDDYDEQKLSTFTIKDGEPQDKGLTDKSAGEYTLIVTGTINDKGRAQDWYLNADASKQAEYQSLIARASISIEITKVEFDSEPDIKNKDNQSVDSLLYGSTKGNKVVGSIKADNIQSYSVCYRIVGDDGTEQEEQVLKTYTLDDTDRVLFAKGQTIGDEYDGVDIGDLDAGKYVFYVRVETSDETASSQKVELVVNPKPIMDTAYEKSLLVESIQYGDKYSDAKVSFINNDELNGMIQLKVKEEDVAKKAGPVNVTVVVANAENLKNYRLSGKWEFKQVLDVTAYAATVQLHDKTIALGVTPTFDASDWEADIRNVNGETKDKVFKVNFRLDDGTPVSAMKNLAPGQYKLMADVDSLDSNYSVGKVEAATLTVGDGGSETNGIQFNKKQIVFTNIGKTREFAAAVVPATESNAGLTFESSDESVATVKVTDAENGKAVVTAVGNGEADIIVTAPNGVSGKLHVTVKQEPKKVVISRSGKTVSGTISVSVGKKYNFDAKVQPSTVFKKGVTWSTSNAKIATVSKKGKVTVKAAGTVKIKATAKGGAKSKTITLKAK